MPIRVILADDHTMMRDGLKVLLEAADISVMGEAGDGRAALQRAILHGITHDV